MSRRAVAAPGRACPRNVGSRVVSFANRIMYRAGFTAWESGPVTRLTELRLEPGSNLLLARFGGWRLESATSDGAGEIAGPLRNVPRTRYRLVRESA